MKVVKIATIRNGKTIVVESRVSRVCLAALKLLTELRHRDDPHPAFGTWELPMTIGQGKKERTVILPCNTGLSRRDDLSTPVCLEGATDESETLVYFRERLYLADDVPSTEAKRREIVLRVKFLAYQEDNELNTIRAAVANYEAAASFAAGARRRDPIPEDVKLIVWTRDGGACVRCGSREQLQFDHVIPVAKGGATTEANVQLLCQPCNLRKSDAISS